MNEHPNEWNPVTLPTEETSAVRDLRAERRRLAAPALAIAFIVLFTSVLQGLLVTLVHRYVPSLVDRDWYVIVMSMVPMYLVSMPLSLLFFRMTPSDPPKKKKLSIPVFLGLLAICFALTYAGNLIGSMVNLMLGTLTGKEQVNDLQNLTMNTPLWANLLFCGILAPILEEVFYRKLVIDRLRGLGDIPVILISGILFGLIHGNFSQFFYAAFIGLILGYIYLNTGRLRYTIGLHMALNIVGGVYATEMMKATAPLQSAADPVAYLAEHPTVILWYAVYFGVILAAVIAAPIAIALLWKYIRFRRAKPPMRPGDWCRAALLNPAVWVLAGVIFILFLGSVIGV